MHSWSFFNAYHSAYLGAKSIMALLGIALPNLAGRQVLIDVCPETSPRARGLGASRFEAFIVVKMNSLDQRDLWEAFQRAIRMTKADCWDANLQQELLDLPYERITPPRNHYLYKANFWPGADLLTDDSPNRLLTLFGGPLDVKVEGFLMRLSFVVYRLAEQLMTDLANVSGVIGMELSSSRVRTAAAAPELATYNAFVAPMSSANPEG